MPIAGGKWANNKFETSLHIKFVLDLELNHLREYPSNNFYLSHIFNSSINENMPKGNPKPRSQLLSLFSEYPYSFPIICINMSVAELNSQRHWNILSKYTARAGHYSDQHFLDYKSPATVARELFKPSTDSASFLLSIKKHYLIWVWDFLLVTSQRSHVFEVMTDFTWPWAPIQWANFFVQTFFRNYAIINVVRALDWPFSISGSRIMTKKTFCSKSQELQNKSVSH